LETAFPHRYISLSAANIPITDEPKAATGVTAAGRKPFFLRCALAEIS
jgi:hypothetical protein